MKCNACQGEISDGRAKCPLCGFPVIQMVGNNEAEIENIRKMGRDYLRQKLEGISIGIMAYGYVMGDDGLQLDQTEEVEVAKADDLEMEKAVWLDQDFQRLDEDGEVTIHVFARKNDKVKTWELPARLPKITGMCHIGIELKAGMKAEMLLGDSSSYTESEDFPLGEFIGEAGGEA